MEQKKILIFSLAYFPSHTSGAEIAVREITNRVTDIEFHLITHRFKHDELATERIGNVTVHRIGGGDSYLAKALFIPRAAIFGRRMHRTIRFDAAWAMMSYMLMPIVIMRIFGVRLPYILSLQEGDLYEHMFGRMHIKPFAPLIRWGFRNAMIIQTISTYLSDWTRRMGYVGPVEVVPNGVDIAAFTQRYPESVVVETRDLLEKNMGDVFLITTSRLVRKNGIDTCIQAMPMLPLNVKFIICGAGSERDRLEKLARDLRVDGRVRFLGKIQYEEIPRYLTVGDIFIRPSRSEGMGNSFVEAMAAGLPVIATQEGGIADFLFDEKRNPDAPITGWAVDKDSPEQIVDAVKEIMARPEKVRAVVATARQMVVEKYDWDLIARNMRERVFSKVTKMSPVASSAESR